MPETLSFCLRPATLLKKRLQYKGFPVNFAKILRTRFITEHLWWLLLELLNGNFQQLCRDRKHCCVLEKNNDITNFRLLTSGICNLISIFAKVFKILLKLNGYKAYIEDKQDVKTEDK